MCDRDRTEHGNCTKDAHQLPRTDDGHSPLDEESRPETAREVSQVGGQERDPGKDPNLLEAETTRVAQILRYPEDIKPPDGVGKSASEDNSPDIRLLEKNEVSPRPRSAGRYGGVTPRFD